MTIPEFVSNGICLLVLCDDATHICSGNGSIAVYLEMSVHYLLSEVQTYFFAFWYDQITCYKEYKSGASQSSFQVPLSLSTGVHLVEFSTD